ncbi:1-4-beta-D-glucan cellobiohydrolase A [Penicillium maclennaniae]|uniref:1-4-beta-D-glucan cellobiohydrolase A n=1 Tax=Penicillium maclennaniae TaxID=1343394 RepID=UPI00254128B3|nr:1-4-beta-D-glucan cellobiohydrolase A [Penicillium maclennaniae]KAJ5682011.1 1-4-beta-D-glucan cellobiohydrolase A [Penicillium maclennaniae]
MYQRALLFSALMAAANAQQVGTQKTETHPPLTWQKCTSSSCTEQSGEVTIDHNWRWVHSVDGYTNCYTGNTWDATLCPDDATCATNCAVDGADYEGTYGVTTDSDALKLTFVTGSNVGSRLYLMEDENTYQMFKLLNQEFTFDVDVSNLGCGLNGALYFVSMDADGGLSEYENNKAGAKYGTGYCDSQCPRDLKFINGQGNVDGWVPSETDSNSGVGNHGSCCAELDPLKRCARAMPAAAPYSAERYAGTCDPDGCDFNPFRMGNESFFGPGKTVDTNSKMTVVTQFITNDGTDTGTLSEIKRLYVQNGKVIANSASDVSGVTGNSITPDFCTAQKKAFGDDDFFANHGGFSGMSTAMEKGMVLVMSLWDDHYSNMLWLDGDYPTDATASDPGVGRGTCAKPSGEPKTIESSDASSTVIFSNIKVGPIGSTYSS